MKAMFPWPILCAPLPLVGWAGSSLEEHPSAELLTLGKRQGGIKESNEVKVSNHGHDFT